jgi:hypothetical protein
MQWKVRITRHFVLLCGDMIGCLFCFRRLHDAVHMYVHSAAAVAAQLHCRCMQYLHTLLRPFHAFNQQALTTQ